MDDSYPILSLLSSLPGDICVTLGQTLKYGSGYWNKPMNVWLAWRLLLEFMKENLELPWNLWYAAANFSYAPASLGQLHLCSWVEECLEVFVLHKHVLNISVRRILFWKRHRLVPFARDWVQLHNKRTQFFMRHITLLWIQVFFFFLPDNIFLNSLDAGLRPEFFHYDR